MLINKLPPKLAELILKFNHNTMIVVLFMFEDDNEKVASSLVIAASLVLFVGANVCVHQASQQFTYGIGLASLLLTFEGYFILLINSIIVFPFSFYVD